MRGKDIIVIGGSAGAIEPIRSILARLPKDFPAALFIVIHTSADSPGVLNSIFDSAGPLPAVFPNGEQKISRGRIYVGRPDHHLIIERGRVGSAKGPKENRFRPAIDPLFRSAAQTYGPRVIGIVFSGGLDDGTSGLWTVKQMGGTAIVQDPQEALVSSMPQSAMNHVRVDHVLPAVEIAPLLLKLVSTPADAKEADSVVPDDVVIEVKIAIADSAMDAGVLRLGSPSNYACPECHGVLLEVKERPPIRFRCHTGHAYTLESLMSEMDEMIEESLWNAIRALEERSLLLRQADSHLAGSHVSDKEYLRRAEESQQRADAVREVVFLKDRRDRKAGGKG